MKKILPLLLPLFASYSAFSQACAFDRQIVTADSVLCAGDSTTLDFTLIDGTPADTVVSTPIVNNNGQDGNMFDIVATNSIRIRYFEGNIANTPNITTEYYIYYKAGSHVGFENNSAAWTLLAGPINFNPNAPNTLSVIPYNLNLVIPAGATYAFYLTNSAAVSNNNRYSTGTGTGNVWAGNADFTLLEGTGGAYPFGTFFNARPWEGTVHYDYPPVSYLWSNGNTTSSIWVSPTDTAVYSCTATVAASCTVQDSITVAVNPLPQIGIPANLGICAGDMAVLDAGTEGDVYAWSTGETTQTIQLTGTDTVAVTVTNSGTGCFATDSTVSTLHSLPTVSAAGETICVGDSASLTATSPTAVTYEWQPGTLSGSSVSVSPTQTTDYVVLAEDANGCQASDSTQVIVNSLPVVTLAPIGNLCVYNAAITLTQGSPAGGNYSGTSINTGTFDPTAAGLGTHSITYAYTDANGCMDSSNTTITVDECLSINEMAGNVTGIFPNPANNQLTVTLNHAEALKVFTVSGTLVSIIPAGKQTCTIEVSGLPNGLYYLQTQSGNTFRFVVSH